jgi:hypothetical protein
MIGAERLKANFIKSVAALNNFGNYLSATPSSYVKTIVNPDYNSLGT